MMTPPEPRFGIVSVAIEEKRNMTGLAPVVPFLSFLRFLQSEHLRIILMITNDALPIVAENDCVVEPTLDLNSRLARHVLSVLSNSAMPGPLSESFRIRQSCSDNASALASSSSSPTPATSKRPQVLWPGQRKGTSIVECRNLQFGNNVVANVHDHIDPEPLRGFTFGISNNQ